MHGYRAQSRQSPQSTSREQGKHASTGNGQRAQANATRHLRNACMVKDRIATRECRCYTILHIGAVVRWRTMTPQHPGRLKELLGFSRLRPHSLLRSPERIASTLERLLSSVKDSRQGSGVPIRCPHWRKLRLQSGDSRWRERKRRAGEGGRGCTLAGQAVDGPDGDAPFIHSQAAPCCEQAGKRS